jgi:hypothetical protein
LKAYRSTSEVLAAIKHVLATNRPTDRGSPLTEVTYLLSNGRHYSWVAIYLAFGADSTRTLLGSGSDAHPGQMVSQEARSKILVSMKMAGREVGILDVESAHDHAFGTEDRALLESVADVLARFLTGPGKYLVRKARETAPVAKKT